MCDKIFNGHSTHREILNIYFIIIANRCRINIVAYIQDVRYSKKGSFNKLIEGILTKKIIFLS